MFDMQEDFRENVQEKLAHGPLDARALLEAIAALSPAEFAELEDDLDFAQFTGVQSELIQTMVAELTIARAA